MLDRPPGRRAWDNPDEETSALAERVRRQRLARPAQWASNSDGNDARPRLPLSGREDELRRMLDVAAAAFAGPHAAVLIVEGEAGVGKTRLVEEVVARLRLDGATVSSARAVPADASQPWSGLFALAGTDWRRPRAWPAPPPERSGLLWRRWQSGRSVFPARSM